jgi:hypothetical protein
MAASGPMELAVSWNVAHCSLLDDVRRFRSDDGAVLHQHQVVCIEMLQ